MRATALTTAAALTAVLALALGGCGGDDNPGNVDSTTSADPLPEESPSATSVPATPDSEPTETTSVSPTASAGPNDFTLKTKDGAVTVTGPVAACDNPDETTLETEFSDGTNTVEVDIERGSGDVDVEGAATFDGRVTSIQVGDVGNVMISGTGGGTKFTVTGTCP